MGIFDQIDEFLRHAGNASSNPLAPAYRGARGLFNTGRIAASPYINTFGRSSRGKTGQNQRAIRTINRPQNRFEIGASGQQEQNPLGDLYEQLLSMLTGPVGVNTEDLMGQVRGQFDPIYDARRQAIENMMGRASERTGRERTEVEGLYNDLAEDYERLAPEAAEQAEEGQEDVERLYGQLASNIEGTYSRISNEQADLFKQLGIEAAAPDVLNPQAQQAAARTSDAQSLGAINEQRYEDIGNIDESYYRQGSPLASLTGKNRSSELQYQLQDYLAGREDDIVGLEAERTSGIQQAYTQLAQQAQAQAAQQQQSQAGMLWDILQSQLQAQQPDMSQIDPADQIFMSMPPQIQQEMSTAIRSLETSEEAVYGKVEDPRHPVPGTFVTTTPEWYLKQIDELFKRGDISPQTRQALIAYYRLKK